MEFEAVFASGQPNYRCCRRPVALNLNIGRWRALLVNYRADPLLPDLLEFGFPLDVQGEVPLNLHYRNHKGARDFPEFIDSYLHKESSLGRIFGAFPASPFSVNLHVSPLNSVPKDDTDRRVIVDLSWPIDASINSSISKDVYLGEDISLHYVTVEDVCNMVLKVGRGALIYKRDLRKAYRQFPVDPRDYRYLGYWWRDELYFDTVLLMGQCNAAMGCQRTTDATMHIHLTQERSRTQDSTIDGAAYLDDMIGVAAASIASDAFDNLGLLLIDLGLQENHSKACPPATAQLVLGVLIDTWALTVSIGAERLSDLSVLLQAWLVMEECSKVELQSLIGTLCFVMKCVRQSRIFINRLLSVLRSFSSSGMKKMPLCPEFRKDIRWWAHFMPRYNGVSIIPPVEWIAPDAVFMSDSTMSGCGGLTDKEYFHTSFPEKILSQDLDINALEILAVTVSVRLWGAEYAGQKILIYCDNLQSVRAINTGETRNLFTASCVRHLWLETCTFGFQLKAVHLPGVENRLADSLSRWDLSPMYSSRFRADTHGLNMVESIVDPSLFDLFVDL